MSRALKILLATALLSLGIPAFAAAGARAQSHTDVISCAFSGLAGVTDPDGAGTGVQSLLTDINDGGPVTFATDFDTGNYRFDGPITCVVQDGLMPANNGVQPATIHSEGDYSNRVCGTGTFESDPDSTTVTFTSMGPPNQLSSVDYQIEFVAGTGAMTIDSATLESHGHSVKGSGVVHITPVQGNCVTVDVSQFEIAGSFTVKGP